MSFIELRKASKSFGDLVVFKKIDLTIEKGEVVILIGPSGAGKSTLLRCMNGLEKITSGDLIVGGLSVKGNGKQLRQIRQNAGMVFQHFNLFPQMTALQNVAIGPREVRGFSKSDALEQAKALLAKIGLSDKADHYPFELSGGQQQRVAIARALAVKPEVMLFDEPTSALDPELKREVLNLMLTLVDEGMTMLVVTHELSFVKKVGRRLIFMEKGEFSADGNPRTILASPPNQRLRDYLSNVHSE